MPLGILVRDDQQTAFVANAFAGNISLINLITGDIIKSFEALIEPDGIGLSVATSTIFSHKKLILRFAQVLALSSKLFVKSIYLIFNSKEARKYTRLLGVGGAL